MRHVLPYVLALVALALCSCGDDGEDYVYPSLVTEMCMARADADGSMLSFTTDGGSTYLVHNTLTGMEPHSVARALCSYEVMVTGEALVYTAQQVPVLTDATAARPQHADPTGIASAWLGGGFVNLHLRPLTHGDRHVWGFVRDSTRLNSASGHTYYISLYHDQATDALAYTTDLYASIALDSLSTNRAATDSVLLRVNTFTGTASWLFTAQ